MSTAFYDYKFDYDPLQLTYKKKKRKKGSQYKEMVIVKRKLEGKNNGTEIYLLKKRNVETSYNQSKKKKKNREKG